MKLKKESAARRTRTALKTAFFPLSDYTVVAGTNVNATGGGLAKRGEEVRAKLNPRRVAAPSCDGDEGVCVCSAWLDATDMDKAK